MTGDLLQSDIDLAQSLLNAGRADSEVVATLILRHLPAARAAHVVRQLRAGIKVDPDLRSASKVVPGQRLAGASVSKATDQARGRNRRAVKQEPSGVPWFTLAVLAAFAVCAAAFFISKRRSQAHDETSAAAAASLPAALEQAFRPGPLALAVQADGLHVGGQLVNRANAFSAVARILGSPSRTNQLQGIERVAYIYDADGLLIYSQPGAGDDSLVLSFDAIGGTNAANKAFSGTFMIAGTPIGAGTDAKKLAAIKELALATPGTDSGVFDGRYKGLELNFAYLESSDRLSLVTINLK